MSKGVEVYVVSPWPRYGGGRMNQLMLQVDGGGSKPCGVEGESLVEVWRGGKLRVKKCRGPPELVQHFRL